MLYNATIIMNNILAISLDYCIFSANNKKKLGKAGVGDIGVPQNTNYFLRVPWS